MATEPTCIDDYDAPDEPATAPIAVPTSWNPPIWNDHENSRVARSSSNDTYDEDNNPLFEDSRTQLELVSRGQDVESEASLAQLEARDEELQELVDKVQQLLITSDQEATGSNRDEGLAESL